jgi:outer membrane protein
MKKTILTVLLGASILFSCQNQTKTESSTESLKTAYVDTSKLMESYNEAKDVEAKYKAKSEEMGKSLEAEVRKFRGEVENYEKNAQTYGMQWAQQKGRELQEKEQQLAYTRQSIIQSLQEENGKEMDSLVTRVKNQIKDFGKEKGYDYIFGTGDAASVLFAKDAYNITDELIKMLNEAYDKTKKSTDSVEK